MATSYHPLFLRLFATLGKDGEGGLQVERGALREVLLAGQAMTSGQELFVLLHELIGLAGFLRSAKGSPHAAKHIVELVADLAPRLEELALGEAQGLSLQEVRGLEERNAREQKAVDSARRTLRGLSSPGGGVTLRGQLRR